MNNLKIKEKNLNGLIEKLSNLSNTYSHTYIKTDQIEKEKNQLESEKKEIENKFEKLSREHIYLKKN